MTARRLRKYRVPENVPRTRSGRMPAACVLACALWASAAPPQPITEPFQPDPGTSELTGLPPGEGVKLSARGAFATGSAAVGDTVVYRLLVEWKDTRVPVTVLAPDTLETPGLRVVDQGATHRKTAENGEVRNATEFTYKLMARMPGGARVSALRLRYLTGFSNREEALYVPAAFIEVAAARIPPWKRRGFQLAALLVLGAGLAYGARRALRAARARRGRARAERIRDFTAEVRALKGRWNTAESRVWIEDAEKVCAGFLRHRLELNENALARFEVLLDQYLSRNPGAEAEGWNKLRELFHHARYAGGRKQPHELIESYRILKTCLHVQGEEP